MCWLDMIYNYVRLDIMDPDQRTWEYKVSFSPEVGNRCTRSILTNIHFMDFRGKVKVIDLDSRLYAYEHRRRSEYDAVNKIS